MKKFNQITAGLLFSLSASMPFDATATNLDQELWSTIVNRSEIDTVQLNTKANKAARYSVNITALEQQLYRKDSVLVDIPLPDGSFATFALTRSNTMDRRLAEKYPSIRTFRGVQLDKPSNIGAFDITPHGFHGVFNIASQTVYIDPMYRNNKNLYHSYFRSDAQPISSVEFGNHKVIRNALSNSASLLPLAASRVAKQDNQLTTLRLAITTTGEYAAYHGGTKEATLAALVTLVNRVNDVYRQDLAVQFELIANNDLLLFTDPETDPFENTDDDIEKVQAVVDEAIGADSYDIGHIVTTGGGGLAGLGVVCSEIKAEGLTGSSAPVNDAFYIDYVAHEIGHQMGAEHTFNGTSEACNGNRSPNSAYEPGSASTIMGYAGICGEQNLQMNSDAFFHIHSIDQMAAVLANAPSCGNSVVTNNNAPSVDAGPDRTIPARTPFTLSGSATDPDGDTVTFSWEQMDLGGQTNSASEDKIDDGWRPLFRTLLPSDSAIRTLPKMSSILANQFPLGETLPTTTREMNFRLVARDAKGNVAYDSMKVNVVGNAEGFAVTEPTDWNGHNQVVTWNTANTENSPVFCSKVDILLSTDSGITFDHELAKSTANDGSAEVDSGNIETTNARLKIACSDNVFFAINKHNFAITPVAVPIKPVFLDQQPLEVNEDETITIALSDLNFKNNQIVDQLILKAGENYTLSGLEVTPTANFHGTIEVNATAQDDTLTSDEFKINITVLSQNDFPEVVGETVTMAQDAAELTIDVLSNDSDIDGDSLSLSSFDYTGTGAVRIEDNKLVYQPAAGFSGEEAISYTVDDGNQGTSQGELTITVTPKPTPTPSPAPSNSGGGSLWRLLLLMAGALPYRFARNKKQ